MPIRDALLAVLADDVLLVPEVADRFSPGVLLRFALGEGSPALALGPLRLQLHLPGVVGQPVRLAVLRAVRLGRHLATALPAEPRGPPA